MKTLRILSLGFTLFPAALCARDLAPAYWFEDLSASDGSTHRCVVFQTTAGMDYRVETSGDLQSWNGAEEVYGLGHQFVVPLIEITPPPPPEPGQDPPPELSPAILVSIQLRPSSAAGGGTVASWKSLDHGGPMIASIAEDLDPGWDTVPIFAERHGDHYFLVHHPAQPANPPAGNPPLGAKDAAMFAVLETHLSDMNATVAASAAAVRNTPAPAVNPGDSGFLRIHYAAPDTDHDGIPDWAEFEIAADPSHPSHDFGNAFDGDADGNGSADGTQTDSDKDGVSDSTDAAPFDRLFDFSKRTTPRLALFPLPEVLDTEGNPVWPIGINDRGSVLFPKHIWWKGELDTLKSYPSEDCSYVARGQNDAGEIVGSGWFTVAERLDALFFATLRWPAPDADPQLVTLPGGDGQLVTAAIAGEGQQPDLFGNDGKLVCSPAYQHDSNGGYAMQGETANLWTLPGNGRQAARAAVAEGMFATAAGCVRGWDAANSQMLFSGPDNPPPPPLVGQGELPLRIKARPGGGLIAFYLGKTPARVFHAGTWSMSPTLGLAHDLSDDGIAIGPSQPGKTAPMMYNGKWHALSKIAPQAPAPWNGAAVELQDISSGGWILASAGEENHAALLPLRVEGHFAEDINGQQVVTRDFVGTDDFSIGSTEPRTAVQDRIWINVPAGGLRTVKISAPLAATHPLTVEGAGLTFGGQNATATLSAAETVLALQAGAGVETGSEIPLDLKIGAVSSLSKPLAVKVMKPRTVKVSIHPVTLKRGNESFAPDMAMTELGLKEALERIYQRQVSVSFQVKIENAKDVEWDLNGDGILQAHDDDNAAQNPEQGTVLGTVPDSTIGAHIRVFVIGSPPPPAGQENTSGLGYLSGFERSATTYPNARRIWMSGSTRNGTRTPAKFQRTLAHEIGHVLLDWGDEVAPGQGHPDQDGGAAPLEDTDDTRRLMVSFGGQGPNPGHLLVKEEWDRIELWLQANIEDEEE